MEGLWPLPGPKKHVSNIFIKFYISVIYIYNTYMNIVTPTLT